MRVIPRSPDRDWEFSISSLSSIDVMLNLRHIRKKRFDCRTSQQDNGTIFFDINEFVNWKCNYLIR